MGKIHGKNSNGGKRGGMPHGKIKIFFFPGYVHTERFGAGTCMACDHAPKEKKSYGKNTWEIWEKLGIGGKKIWEIWKKLGNLWGKKSEYGKNWVRFRIFVEVPEMRKYDFSPTLRYRCCSCPSLP